MTISKENYTLVKKDISNSRLNPQVVKRATFAHKITSAQVGLTVVPLNLLSLNTPTDMTALGFVQITSDEVNGLRLSLSKKNLRLSSTLKGVLFPNKHYVVVDNYTINLIGDLATAIELDEIIYGEIDSQMGDLIPATVKTSVKTVSVGVGQQVANLGLEYQVNANSIERVGAIQIKVRNGSVLYRNTNNSSVNLDGDYYEVDSGTGYGTTVMLNTAPTSQPLELVVDFGVNTITNNDSLGTMQSLMGSMIKIAKDLAIVVGGSQSDYLSANPSDIERRSFGDSVLSLLSRYDLSDKLSTLVNSMTARILSLETTQTVFASYFLSTNTSFTAGTPINFNSIFSDPYTAVTTGANWKFTVPAGKAGLYKVDTILAQNTTNCFFHLYKNNAFNQQIRYHTSALITAQGNVQVYLAVGDYIDIRPDAICTVLGANPQGGGGQISKVDIYRAGP